MNHIVLFGASGFLGGHVRAALGQHPLVGQLTCLGRDRCDLLRDGVEDIRALLRHLRPTAVVNCTGVLDGSPSELVRANTLATATLLEALAFQPGVRYIRLGSAGEYGPVPCGRAVNETDTTAPVGAYGLSHLAATQLVQYEAAAGRVDGITLRVFNPIGAGMSGATLLGRAAGLLRAALRVGSTRITMGPLTAYRDFVDARDVAAAVVAAILAPRLDERVVNIGSGEPVCTRTAVSMLAQVAAFAGDVVEQGEASARSSTVDWMLADVSRASQVLGWRPAHELADSVKTIWADRVEAVAL